MNFFLFFLTVLQIVVSDDSDEIMKVYVAHSGIDTNPGTETAPFGSIQAAVDVLKKSKKEGEIYVSEGTYDFEPIKIEDQDVKIIAKGSCHLKTSERSKKSLFTVSKGSFELEGFFIDVYGIISTPLMLVDTKATITSCVISALGENEDGRSKPVIQQKGGETYIDKCQITGFEFLTNPAATVIQVGGKSPATTLTDCFMTSMTKTSSGIVLSVDKEVMGGFKVLCQFCDFTDIFPPVMGGGYITAGNLIGDGQFTLTKCNFMGHNNVSGGIIFANQKLGEGSYKEEVDEGEETDLEEDEFHMMAFPVLPPSAVPVGGWYYSDDAEMSIQYPHFYKTVLRTGNVSSTGEIELDEGESPDGTGIMIDGMPFTFLTRALMSVQLPCEFLDERKQPRFENKEEKKEDEEKERGQGICGEWEGKMLHLTTPCKPSQKDIKEGKAVPQSIQHFFIKSTEEKRTRKEREQLLGVRSAVFQILHQSPIQMKDDKEE
ncbi:uncharacterized protein MONOS_2603 [Monocercomonoides exilis]|uniref:uncharacterized protein n=1 Tax=Monocercomonoides exilis TaxID=2049356 RepID=UPI003559BE7A|nr:hypothetical protein MONOS_2603 [Monocercomonoides exilis]|eukprot:MONOS_2603.1-p1 / transcript=MONOS_2603.1 / gene=MONOS_2603 / organism=Monocercomonoides_exilis_PA203 / gene_product=unspecified product / transcript_product=unspecified product / location=Mono_scaffold00054:151391-152924(-) / protein_length=489 / sequence_SO=supercontig / SO=protein_coding / is_pseudo=false